MAFPVRIIDSRGQSRGPLRVPVGKPRVTVAATVTAVLDANPKRTHAYIQADFQNTENVFLGLGVAATLNEGVALSPDALLEIDADWMYRGSINAICASGGQYLHIFEA